MGNTLDSEPVTQEMYQTDPAYESEEWMEILRKSWVVLQTGIGLWWAVQGYLHWNKVHPEFNKTKLVLIVGFFVFAGVLFNEFVYRSLDMIFMLLAISNYVNFITFCLVVDSCQTTEMDASWSKQRTLNFVFRLLMHCGMITMIFLCIFGPTNCRNTLYPWPFLTLAYTIVLHNLYDLFLYKRNYLVKLDKLPPPSECNMRFNKDLFKRQTFCLLLINIVFGVMGLTVLVCSYVFIAGKEGIHVVCIDGVVWQPLDIFGTIFIAAHQALIMMQVKMMLTVLYRIPNGMGLFRPEDDMSKSVRKNIRIQLIDKLRMDNHEEGVKKFEESDRKVKDLTRV